MSAMKMLRAPSFRIESPCSRFAARFPRARAASLETRGEEDPSAFFKRFHFNKKSGKNKLEFDRSGLDER